MAEGVKDEWWFKKMLSSRQPMDTPSETQSKLLSELDSVYELQSKFGFLEDVIQLLQELNFYV